MEEKTVYYISEAAKKVQVESHVLRYWEDELELPIMRNEMGHRYYTEQDIKKLQEIKQLKEQGLQLKAIRTILFRMPESIGEKAEHIFGQTDKPLQAVQQTVRETGKGKGTIQASGAAAAIAGQKKQEETKAAAAITERQREKANDVAATTGQKQEEKNGATTTTERQRKANGAATITERKQETNSVAANTEQKEATGKDMTEQRIDGGSEQIDIDKPQRFIVALAKEKEAEAVQVMPPETQFDDEDRSRKAARLQYLLQHMITEAVKTANRELCTDVKESIIKELDYQFRMQEERDEERWKKEEEHYRKIDEMIRERHRPKERLGRGKKKSPATDDPVSL